MVHGKKVQMASTLNRKRLHQHKAEQKCVNTKHKYLNERLTHILTKENIVLCLFVALPITVSV